MTRLRGSWSKLRLLWTVAALAGASPCVRATDTAHQVRSAFIYNFSKYIQFPEEALPEGHPFVIGLEGDDAYGGDLESALAGKSVNGHGFEIKRVRSEAEMRNCQFLIVGDSDVRKAIRSVQGASVVTIGEGADFAKEGGVIAFVTSDSRIRFDINIAASKGAKVSISSRMLGLALQIYR